MTDKPGRVWRCGLCGDPCKGHGEYLCVRYYEAEPRYGHPAHRICRPCRSALRAVNKQVLALPCVQEMTDADKSMVALTRLA